MLGSDENQWTGWQPSPHFRDYLAEIHKLDTSGLARGRLVASLRLLVPHSLREKIKLGLTDLQSPRTRKTLARLSSSGEAIYLNLGCGDQPIEEWVNIRPARHGSRRRLKPGAWHTYAVGLRRRQLH